MSDALGGYWLTEPKLRFEYENRHALDTSAYNGIKRWGPSDINQRRKSGERIARAVIIGRAQRTDEMAAAKAALQTTKQMGKLHDVFTLKFVEEVLVPAVSSPRDEAKAYRDAVREWLARHGGKPPVDIAFVIHAHEEFYNANAGGESPYYAVKAELLAANIPTQHLCYKNLRGEGQLDNFRRFYVPNILTASYAKLGGTPWVIQDDTVGRPEITLGVATTAIHAERRRDGDGEAERYVGISTIFKENGAFALWKLTPLRQDWDQYKQSLEDSIVDAITTFEEMERKQVSRIACHISGKRAGRLEREAIESALRRLTPRTIAADLVHISQDATLWLLDGTDVSLRPNAGFLAQLSTDGRMALMHTEGRNSRGKKYPPRPLKIGVHSAAPEHGCRDIFQHLYDLRWMSWRGVATGARPVSIDYPARMAKLLANLDNQERLDFLRILPQHRGSAWFL